MALEAGEVDVGDEEDRLRLEVAHHLEGGDVVLLLQQRDLDVGDWGAESTRPVSHLPITWGLCLQFIRENERPQHGGPCTEAPSWRHLHGRPTAAPLLWPQHDGPKVAAPTGWPLHGIPNMGPTWLPLHYGPYITAPTLQPLHGGPVPSLGPPLDDGAGLTGPHGAAVLRHLPLPAGLLPLLVADLALGAFVAEDLDLAEGAVDGLVAAVVVAVGVDLDHEGQALHPLLG